MIAHARRASAVTPIDHVVRLLLWLLLAGGTASGAHAQEAVPPESVAGGRAQTASDAKTSLEIYGFAMMDVGHDFTQIDPDWFDTLRVTKLPSSPDQFGRDHNTFAGVRQTRVGVRTSTPTAVGELRTLFEFNLLGSGVDAGQTTFRLRHAWGELGAFGAGQTWSVFTDPDASPRTLEAIGPTGLASFRNVQVRWTPLTGRHGIVLAIERPGASADDGIYADRIELQNIRPRFPAPDVTAAYRYTARWGHVRGAGLVRLIRWDDVLEDQFELSGDATGWGLNLSSSIKAGRNDVIRMALAIGEGIQNYMNDSPVDIGIVNNFANPVTPIVGRSIPVVGVSAFVEHAWSDRLATTFGYSRQDNDNTDAQQRDAFRDGEYAVANTRYMPVPDVMIGGELQWGRRYNFSDGFHSDGIKAQFSFKYSFSWRLER